MSAATASPLASNRLRRVPRQERSRETVRRVLDAAGELLARDGAGALSTTRVAEAAGVAVGSLYQYFPDKEAIAEALAQRYWGEFEERVAAVAESDEREPEEDPAGAVLDALAAGFRARPGFLALWYGGLRSERIRDATRPTRTRIAACVEQVIAVHWPRTDPELRGTVARMAVLVGDGLLRESFRLHPQGDATVLAEGRHVLGAYMTSRLGKRAR
jgi:AcrR family transcriptional regulator